MPKTAKGLSRKQIQDVKLPALLGQTRAMVHRPTRPTPSNHAERVDKALIIHRRRPLTPTGTDD